MFDPIVHDTGMGKSVGSCLLWLHYKMLHEFEEREEIQISTVFWKQSAVTILECLGLSKQLADLKN